MPVVTQIQIRRGTASQWTSANPTLASGEFGYETDTGKAKIGNGSTAWNSLAYAISGVTGDIEGVTAGTGLQGGGTSGTVTLSIDSTVATLSGTQTLTNKTLTTPVISTISNTGTLTLPISTDTLVGRDTTDTLTNKTLTTPVIASISNSGTITIPAGTDTLVGRATTDTLTNKTLTAPTITLATNAQTASYTLVLADANKIVEMSVAGANNLTVPLNSSQAFPVGSSITILQTGAGQTTIVATGGVTVNGTPGLKLRAQWSSATLIKRATDTWVAIGDLSA